MKGDLKGRLIRIALKEVLYIGGRHITCLTMKELEDYLPKESFVRVHKSFIAEVSIVKGVEGYQIILDYKATFPLGATHREAFLTEINVKLWKSRRLA